MALYLQSVLEAEPVNPTSDIFSPRCNAKTSVDSHDDLPGAVGSPTATTSDNTEFTLLETPSGFPVAPLEAAFMLDAYHDVLVDSADFQVMLASSYHQR